jgi:hypothetical protein
MDEQTTTPIAPIKHEKLSALAFIGEVLRAIGATLGLGILWALEIVRDRFFRLLDLLNLRPRRRGATAFPPGRPKHKSAA